MQEVSQQTKTRVTIISIIIYVLSGLLFIRLFYLQLIKGESYLKQSLENKSQVIAIPAYRSVIYDTTEENRLAYNRKSLAIVCIPANLPIDEVEKETALSNVAELLNLQVEDIKATIEEQALDKYTPIVLKSDIDSYELVHFAEHNELYPGMFWENRPRRIYPLREAASQMIGYTGIISRSELDELESLPEYHSGSVLGKMGIEDIYDETIRGNEGSLDREVDAKGKVLDQTIIKDAVPGNPLVLSIHYDMQEMAYDLLEDRLGAVVVSKPSTGELLTLVSSPGFDPNIFTDYFSDEEFYLLKNDEDKPFLNRAIQGYYPPASVFKLVTALAALDSGISPTYSVKCPGYLRVGNRTYKCWNTHGTVDDIYEGIAESCDTYFYTVGLQMGREPIVDLAQEFGLDEKTQVDLPNETTGLVPLLGWFTNAHGRPWSSGDTANIAIGQGDLLATPIGINAMTMAIVNDGVMYKPFILKKVLTILDKTPIWEKEPEVLRKINLDEDYFEVVKTGMYQVYKDGTASWLKWLTDVPLGGKTGTGQAGGDLEDHAWFTCFAPYGYTDIEDVICVTVLVEHGGGGSSAAAPIAAKLIDYYFDNVITNAEWETDK